MNIPSQTRRVYILLKGTWNILQDRSYLGPQIKPWYFFLIEIIASIFSDSNVMRLEINFKKKKSKKHKLLENRQYDTKQPRYY